MLPLAILMGAGAVLGAAGKLYEGQAAKKAAEYNHDIAKRNAMLARKQAQDEERQVKVSGRKAVGQMIANMSANGVQVSGSALDLLSESAANIERDVLNVRAAGEQKAQAYMEEAKQQRNAGNAAQNASYFGAASSLIGGAGDYYKLTRT